MLRFDGRVALVTGGGSGIGRAHALALAARGARVVVNARPRTGPRPDEAVCEEIRRAGGTAIAAAGVIGVDADAQRIVQAAVEAFGRLDIVVNNAGTYNDSAPIEQDPSPAFQAELDVHLLGALQVNRAAWPHMRTQGYGRILFTGSSVGLGWYRGANGFEGDYACAKAALFGATGQTAAAGEAHGIKANLMMPWAYTPQAGRALDGTELGRWMEANLRPETIAAGSLYLLHEECPVNGQAISIAGGRMTRILFASPEGYFNPELTPEDVRANWAAIEGRTDPDGRLRDMVEIKGQAGEFAILEQRLRSGGDAMA